jgi:hypothetical protein
MDELKAWLDLVAITLAVVLALAVLAKVMVMTGVAQ